MGYLAVVKSVALLDGQEIEPRIDTGVEMVTKANVDQPEIQELVNPDLDKWLK